MSVYLAEFIGVSILIFLGCGVIAGNSLKESGTFKVGSLAINLVWGFAVAIAMYAVGDISGAHLNPVITVTQALRGNLSWTLVPGYILAQVLGAMFGSFLVYLEFLPHWKVTEDETVKLDVFVTSPQIQHTMGNFISEYLVTFTLIFFLFILDKNQFVEGIKPLVVGGIIFSLGTCFGGVTGAALNPARDLGPRLAHFLLPIPGKGSSDFGYAWIPMTAPLLGGITATFVYLAIYEKVIDVRLFVIMLLNIVVLSLIKVNSKINLKKLSFIKMHKS